MKMASLHGFIALSALASTLMACGTALPPAELVNARKSMDAAKQGPAPEQVPADLHSAKQALAKAEAVFEEQGPSRDAKDLAYVALRKVEYAEAAARARIAQSQKDKTERELQKGQADALHRTKSDLQNAQAQLEKSKEQLARSKEQLDRETQLRIEAEKKAAQAMADLQKIAAVKQETRGMVITLSGSVLFATNESTLLPAAMLKLNEVADALVKGNPDANIVVEGHTDSQGTKDYNQTLSLKRAEAVREHLVSRGVAADRIKAVGIGSERSVADNKSTEGRANNRRVEIIVEPAKK
jgi:outer membrane protein OmpA-like peptidoglycan-associated protein